MSPAAEAVAHPLADALGRRPRTLGDLGASALAVAATLLFMLRGVAYPVGVEGTDDAWGGPTLAGAWAVHLLVAAAILAAVGLLLGLRPAYRRRSRPDRPDAAPTRAPAAR